MTIQQSVTHQLLIPITFEGKEHKKITLRRPKTKDLQAIDKKEGVEQTIAMIARLSEWPHDAISELDINDLSSIGEILESFIKRREISIGKPPLN
ncbi:phage tail assembly protein [Bartonella krasnovii]|uniref:phage tail assembly protein n=1 Tax=Bartonella krasnovii TaxID=2267275 RepID=UPI001F4CE760|nr:phage tail assembly protein [Bartonella krasnovii]UNF39090.1 phage tail assembly protein [Bartonella krasnovii]UNF44099.1 phage tail assembly protein [Bartonella krasnovii]UNF50631.1 phage tail assembly protein [Bartonella krasnovii]